MKSIFDRLIKLGGYHGIEFSRLASSMLAARNGNRRPKERIPHRINVASHVEMLDSRRLLSTISATYSESFSWEKGYDFNPSEDDDSVSGITVTQFDNSPFDTPAGRHTLTVLSALYRSENDATRTVLDVGASVLTRQENSRDFTGFYTKSHSEASITLDAEIKVFETLGSSFDGLIAEGSTYISANSHNTDTGFAAAAYVTTHTNSSSLSTVTRFPIRVGETFGVRAVVEASTTGKNNDNAGAGFQVRFMSVPYLLYASEPYLAETEAGTAVHISFYSNLDPSNLDVRLFPVTDFTLDPEHPETQDNAYISALSTATKDFRITNTNIKPLEQDNEYEAIVPLSLLPQGFLAGASKLLLNLDSAGNSYLGKYFNEIEMQGGQILKILDLPTASVTASIDHTLVAPVVAPTLNLTQLIGGTEINVPVTITNPEPATALGDATVRFYLSTTPEISGDPVRTTPINVGLGELTEYPLTMKIPGEVVPVPNKAPKAVETLIPGEQYFIIAEITFSNPNLPKVVAVTDVPFHFVGTATRGLVINPDKQHANPTYFTVIAEAKNNVIQYQDGAKFTAEFEGNIPRPYLDDEDVPSIGIGISLNSLSESEKTLIVDKVRPFYATKYAAHARGYIDISSYSDDQVLTMLKSQAFAAKATKTLKDDDPKKFIAPDAMSLKDGEEIFPHFYDKAYVNASKLFDNYTWYQIFNEHQRIAIVDVFYNLGSLSKFPSTSAALLDYRGPDFLRAAFNLLDSKRSASQIQYQRSLAEFEYLTDELILTYS